MPREYRSADPVKAAKAARMRDWRARNAEKDRAYQRAYKRRQRELVYAHYGPGCACCGELRFEFLSIDHTEGGGTQHRLAEGIRGSGVIQWLINQGLPEGFRILCHNCNQAIGFYGTCPHEREALADGDQ